MTRLWLVVALLAWPTLSVAQTAVCRTVVQPDQGTTFNTAVVVPAHTLSGIYPVFYLPPANAVSVGLEFWAHRIRTAGVPDPPKDVVVISGYLVDAATNHGRLVMPQASRGGGQDGIWRVFPMSTFVHKGEYFTVGLYNVWDQAVVVDLAITIRECVTP